MKEEKVFLRSKSLPQEKACNNLGEDGVWRIFETFKKAIATETNTYRRAKPHCTMMACDTEGLRVRKVLNEFVQKPL